MKYLLLLFLAIFCAFETQGQRMILLSDTAQIGAVSRYESVASEYRHFGLRHGAEYGIFVVQEVQTSEGTTRWRFSSWQDDTWRDFPALPTHYTLVGRRMILFYSARLSEKGYFEFVARPKTKRACRSWERIVGDRVYKRPRWTKRISASRGPDKLWKTEEDTDHRSFQHYPPSVFNGYVYTFGDTDLRFVVN